MPLFEGSHNFVINGGIFNDSSTNGLGPLVFLQGHSASGAAHDSEERYPPPSCHPQTRIRTIEHIIVWIRLPRTQRSKSVFWLFAPAGMGKTAIAQTIAEKCEEMGVLAGTFFFHRSNTDRNRASKLVASLALQISTSIPPTRQHIENAIRANPAILTKSLPIQLKKLIIEPVLAVGSIDNDRAIIIDGLDECIGPPTTSQEQEQHQVLELIQTLLSSNLPLIILIFCRPETWITESFNALPVLSGATERFDLYRNSDLDHDVEVFLRSEFSKIATRTKQKPGKRAGKWPADEDIKALISRASGQFIYAATVVRYIGDPWHTPRDRLRNVFSAKVPEGHNPLEGLDNLYLEILGQSQNLEMTREVLACLRECQYMSNFDTLVDLTISKARSCEIVCRWPPHALRGLTSLVQTDGIFQQHSFYHGTFFEFLSSPNRSKQFYTDAASGGLTFLQKMLEYLAFRETSGSSEQILGDGDDGDYSDSDSSSAHSPEISAEGFAAAVWPELWFKYLREASTVPGVLYDAFLSYRFSFNNLPRLYWESRLLDELVLMGLGPHVQRDFHRVQQCLSHLQGEYDRQVKAALGMLDLDDRDFIRGLVDQQLCRPQPVLDGSYRISHDGFLGRMGTHQGLYKLIHSPGLTESGGDEFFLNPEFLAFLATPSRSEGWYRVPDMLPEIASQFHDPNHILEWAPLSQSADEIVQKLKTSFKLKHAQVFASSINTSILRCICYKNVSMALTLMEFFKDRWSGQSERPVLPEHKVLVPVYTAYLSSPSSFYPDTHSSSA
ncbi:hypothetical protein FA15DRAFT_672626 [Coprinopsis marcescibilis]|uniref:Nephrocystin 3-like N-terminal domain-containing protein n=1 Tax=Coprinopsis marcescibilis TaxID=230819 RepID=A0A5C3KM43_COPMA|nr:hypothetical protein FA15DRAFT_672626 [Coprinopsis marcescibilis]